MILAAHQPQYLAYTGYFDKLDQADVFVLLDTVQYKKNEWINRNRIKTPNGPLFVTVPVSFSFGDTIKDVRLIPNNPWLRKHLQSIRTYYGKAEYFKEYIALLQQILMREYDTLSELNNTIIIEIARWLGIETRIETASNLPEMPDQPDRRLIELAKHFGCDTYLAGSGGRDYMDASIWQGSGVKVQFQQFEEPERMQMHGDLIPNLSIIDLLMNEGGESLKILRQVRKSCQDWQ